MNIVKKIYYWKAIVGQNILPIKNKLPILLYHKIEESDDRLAVSPKNLETQLKYLHTDGYQSIDFDKLEDYFNQKLKLNQKKVLITFDDGYKNNYQLALPILNKYGFKAIFFISTKHIDSQEMMNQQELKDLVSQGHIVASHFHSHENLIHLAKDEIRREHEASAEIIKNLVGLENYKNWAAYPRGKVNSNVIKILKEFGLRFGFKVGNKMAAGSSHHLKIPRIEIYPNDDLFKFRARLSPYFYFLKNVFKNN